MLVRQWRACQRGVDAPIGAGDGFRADGSITLAVGSNRLCRRRLATKEAASTMPPVGLPRQLVKAVNGEAIVLRRSEAVQAQHRLQFEQVFAARLGPLAVSAPGIRRQLDLRGHHPQQRRERRRIRRQDHTRKPQVAKLDGESQPVRRPTPLADECQVGIAEGVQPNQLVAAVRDCNQAVVFGSREDRTPRHALLGPLRGNPCRTCRRRCRFAQVGVQGLAADAQIPRDVALALALGYPAHQVRHALAV